jgi:predicted nucleotidyltransferase
MDYGEEGKENLTVSGGGGSMIPKREQVLLDRFVSGLREILSERLLSVVLYGSAVQATYQAGSSDINLIVLVDNPGVDDFLKIKKSLGRVMFRARLRPFFFTPDFLRTSSDVFPLEWKEIKEHYRIIQGKDFVQEIAVAPDDLRLQLEREVKQNFLNFQQALIFRKDLTGLLRDAVKSLKVLMRNFPAGVGTEIAEPEYFKILQEKAGGRKRLTAEEAEKISAEHLAFLKELIDCLK